VKRVKIKSDGTIRGTLITNEDGTEIPGVTRIDIGPIDAKNPKLIEVKVTLVNVELELDAEIASIDANEGITNRKGEKTYEAPRKEGKSRLVAHHGRIKIEHTVGTPADPHDHSSSLPISHDRYWPLEPGRDAVGHDVPAPDPIWGSTDCPPAGAPRQGRRR
jgi:hypothetical protein